jgi:signal transduction histidine kinase
MKKFDWAALLRHHPILSSLDDRHVRFLLSEETSSEQSYKPGETIIREGEVGDSLFLIGSGSVDVVLAGAGGQTILLSLLLPGETFGEMGLFERRPRCATVRARDGCVVLEVKGEDLRRLGEAQPDVEFKVLLKVSERLRSNNEHVLALHLKDLEGANRAKDEFLAMLGHELRNPLAAIGMAVHLLETGEPGEDPIQLRAIIARQTRHLSRLVDDLLDVSRLISGKVTLRKRALDVKDLAVRVVSSLQALGRTAGHDVSVTGERVKVDGDVTRLEQVVSNLLDNALKYTPAGGRIEVTIGAEGGDAVLRLRDAGVGIDSETLPRIFDVFVQADQTAERSGGGLGLGLTLVKRLVELHGGTVSATSAGPDRGSEFVVRIPRLTEAAPATPRPGGPGGTPRGRRIVIIEDNPDFRDALRVLLESWGHHVEEAATGNRGLELIRESHPEVALVDLGLPGLDGYAVAEAVRSAPGGENVLLVAITGYGGLQVRRRTKDVGFDAHLTKPVNLKALERIIVSRAESAD